MKLLITPDTTSKLMHIFVPDSSSTVGAGLTGLVYNSAGLTWHYYREGQGTGATAVTLATATLGTWTSGGFKEIDATNMPGWYEIGVPDAVLASGAATVGMVLDGATNMAPVNIEIQMGDIAGGDVSSINGSVAAAVRLALSAGQIIPGTVDTASFTPTTSAFECDDITEATTDHYRGRVWLWTSGNLIGQVAAILGYSLQGSNGRFTVATMTEAPGNNDTGVII